MIHRALMKSLVLVGLIAHSTNLMAGGTFGGGGGTYQLCKYQWYEFADDQKVYLTKPQFLAIEAIVLSNADKIALFDYEDQKFEVFLDPVNGPYYFIDNKGFSREIKVLDFDPNDPSYAGEKPSCGCPP